MIIRAEIASFDVSRILIDMRSLVSITFVDCFKELRIAKENVKRHLSPLLSFSGDLVQPIDSVSLLITFSMASKRTMIYDQFIIVDYPMVYNMIIGRTTLTAISQIVTSKRSMESLSMAKTLNGVEILDDPCEGMPVTHLMPAE